ERDQTLIAGQNRRRGESQPRVFHPANREARRQHQNVVAPPAVRPVQLLGRLNHLLGVREFARSLLKHRGLGVNARARAQGFESQVADRERDQVRRDRLRHIETIIAVARGVRVLFGAWIASDCVNIYGCFLPAVCAGSSHCTPEAPGVLSYSMRTFVACGGSWTVSGAPRILSASPSANDVGVKFVPSVEASALMILKSRVSSLSG